MADLCGFGQLPHGAKILWETVPSSRTVSLGFFFPTGSRFDPFQRNGIAHFVEHMVFKGTASFTALELARSIDRVGGDLNAYTDREELVFLCTVPSEAWRTALDVLCELVFFPTFPDVEVEREREVIRNEILASKEDPEESSYEDFFSRWATGVYALPVAGTEKSLSKISRDDLISWWNRFCRPEFLTVSAAGAIDPIALSDAVSQKLVSLSLSPQLKPLDKPTLQSKVFRYEKKAPFQMAQVIGGFSFERDPNPEFSWEGAWFSILWGESMSSRLFQNIREQKGLCYSVSSQFIDGDNGSALHFFASCAPENTRAVVEALKTEILDLDRKPPTRAEWEDARQALRGGTIIASERMENRLQRLVHHFWAWNSVEPWEDSLEGLMRLNSEEVWSRWQPRLQLDRSSLLVWGRWKALVSGELTRIWED